VDMIPPQPALLPRPHQVGCDRQSGSASGLTDQGRDRFGLNDVADHVYFLQLRNFSLEAEYILREK
jgi:hypothetical protein